MKLFVLFVNLAFLTAALAKLAHYDYAQPEEQNLAYTPQEQRAYAPPPQYTTMQTYQQQNYAPVEETYKKQFFIFSAPDEDFEDRYAAHKISSTIQKNVRVVFIRAPEQKGLEQAALQLAKQVSDDKTAIYVLNKQTDIGDLANRLSVHREQYTHKPEVHFVKYRTPEDAAHAQQQIQAHYDTFRGSSQTSNEGAAKVLDFTSKQQPIYGSAISIAPAYAGVNNAGSNLNGYYGQQVASNAGLAVGYENTANTAALNSYSSYKTVGYNTNSATTTNGGSYANVGAAGGYESAGYNANEAGSENAAPSTAFNGYVDPRASNVQQLLAENRVSSYNERPNAGGRLTFPNEVAVESTYLPANKRRQ